MDRDLWDQMRIAFAQISMPLNAHQQIQMIMQQIDAEAQKRAFARKENDKDAGGISVHDPDQPV